MADYTAIYKPGLDAQLAALLNRLNQQKTGVQQQQQAIQTEQDQTLPGYTQKIGDAAAQGWQQQQALARLAGQTGNLTTGQLGSNVLNLQNGVKAQQGQYDTQRNQYMQSVRDRLNQLHNTLQGYQNDYDTGALQANADYQGKIAAAQLADQQAAERAAQQAATRASRASGGTGGKLTGGSTNPQTAANQAIDAAIANGATYNDLQGEILAQSAQLQQAGVNVQSVLNYAYSQLRKQPTANVNIPGHAYTAQNGYYSATRDYANGAANGGRGMGGYVPY